MSRDCDADLPQIVCPGVSFDRIQFTAPGSGRRPQMIQRARSSLICGGLPGDHIWAGLVPRSTQQPSIREPIKQLLRRRCLAQGEQPRQGIAEVRERVDPQMLAGADDGIHTAAVCPPTSLPMTPRALRPRAMARSVLSLRLLSITRKPCSRYRFSASQLFVVYPIAVPSGDFGNTSGRCSASHFDSPSHTGSTSRRRIARRCFSRCRRCSRCTGSSDGGSNGGNARSIAYNLPNSSRPGVARSSPASPAATNLRRACATQHTCFTRPRRRVPRTGPAHPPGSSPRIP